MSTNTKKNDNLIACASLVVLNKELKMKIGKINDSIDTDKCFLTKDIQTKTFKLTKKKNKSDIKYTGSLLAEQSSKYFIFKFNEVTQRIEAYPGDDWYTFKKDIQYTPMSLDEAEEKLKEKSGFMDYIRNKGNIAKGGKKEKAIKEEKETGMKVSKFNDEDEDVLDEIRPLVFEREQKSEEDRVDDIDPELKDIPSDLEEVFLGKMKDKDKAMHSPAVDESIDEEESESSDAFFGKKDEESDDVDDDELSSILENNESSNEEIINQGRTKQNELIGIKRKGEEINNLPNKGKKLKTTSEMEDVLDYLFSKNKRMTYEKIVRELTRLDFRQEQISLNLPIILSRSCGKYPQGGENFYFKKSYGEK